MKREKLIVFTDGGSRGNPGPGAIGVILKDSSGRTIRSFGEAIGPATNNEAEYKAVIFALQKIKSLLGSKKIKNIEIQMNMDSELVKKQLGGEYKIEEEKLFPLFIKTWNLKMDFAKITFNHVPREQNKEADRMVNDALNKNQQNLLD